MQVINRHNKAILKKQNYFWLIIGVNPMPKRTRSHEQSVIEQLSDDAYAVAYLNAAIDEANVSDDPSGILIALRRIAEAKGMGMTRLSKAAEVNRQGMYKILSEQGNPE